MNEPHRVTESRNTRGASHCIKYASFLLLVAAVVAVTTPVILQIGTSLLVKYRLRTELKGIKEIHLGEHTVTLGGNDEQTIAAATVLAKYPHFISLDIYGRDVTDEALPAISMMTSLEILTIKDAKISDDGLQVLCNLRNLKMLSLIRCEQITDRGILHLTCFPELGMLAVNGTQATEACLEPLLRTNPSLKNGISGISAKRREKS